MLVWCGVCVLADGRSPFSCVGHPRTPDVRTPRHDVVGVLPTVRRTSSRFASSSPVHELSREASGGPASSHLQRAASHSVNPLRWDPLASPPAPPRSSRAPAWYARCCKRCSCGGWWARSSQRQLPCHQRSSFCPPDWLQMLTSPMARSKANKTRNVLNPWL